MINGVTVVQFKSKRAVFQEDLAALAGVLPWQAEIDKIKGVVTANGIEVGVDEAVELGGIKVSQPEQRAGCEMGEKTGDGEVNGGVPQPFIGPVAQDKFVHGLAVHDAPTRWVCIKKAVFSSHN